MTIRRPLAVLSVLLSTTAATANGAPQRWPSAPPWSLDAGKALFATLATPDGDIKVSLFPGQAPRAANSFVFLANQGFYSGLTFHRVISGFMIQGGDPKGTGVGGPGYTFRDELPERYVKYHLGSLAMANAGPNTNGSQFFIVTGRNGVSLPPNYTLFGQVVEGLNVAQAISRVPTDDMDAPLAPVVMTGITVAQGDSPPDCPRVDKGRIWINEIQTTVSCRRATRLLIRASAAQQNSRRQVWAKDGWQWRFETGTGAQQSWGPLVGRRGSLTISAVQNWVQ